MLSLNDKKELLLRYYRPTLYQGVVFTLKLTDAEPSKIWMNSMKESSLATKEKREVKKWKLFNFEYYLGLHIMGLRNLAVLFPKKSSHIMAFDLDAKVEYLTSELWKTVKILYKTLTQDFSLIPFVYMSGGKGFHIDVSFRDHIPVIKLQKAIDNIKAKAFENGADPVYFDCTYPSNKPYRIFGTWHYKTGLFTSAFDSNFRILSEVESWVYFKSLMPNGNFMFEKLIDDMPEIEVAVDPNKKSYRIKKKTLERVRLKWDLETLRKIHEGGLLEGYTRYVTAFNLGRYFRFELNLMPGQVEKEIDAWLQRHYEDLCPHDNMIPFSDEVRIRVKTPYQHCRIETIRNCVRGYEKGKSFRKDSMGKVLVKIDVELANEYMDSLPRLSERKKEGLKHLVRVCSGYESLFFSQSYEQFLNGWKLKSRDSVSEWLKSFKKMGILKCIETGSYKKRKASTYLLELPSYCYREIKYINSDNITDVATDNITDVATDNITDVATDINAD